MTTPLSQYNVVEKGYAGLIRGTNQQTDVGLLWLPPRISLPPGNGSPPSANVSTLMGGIRFGGFRLHNRSGGAANVGIAARVPNYLWKAGQWVEATTTFTDDTTDAQDAGTNDFALETTTNDDGFVVLSRIPFNGISFNVSTASVDATDPARALQYSSGTAGHTWTTLSNLYSSTGAAAELATGEGAWVWATPSDHTATTADNGLGTGIPKGYYAIKIAATTAPDTTAALAATMEIFQVLHLLEALADNGVYEGFFGTSEAGFAPECDALAAFFSVSNAQNTAGAFVRSAG